MAMSDTCYETLGSLSSDFMHYIDWGYDGKDLSLVVDSMYNLAKFGVLHDNFDRPTDEWLAEAAHRVVISSLLEDMEITVTFTDKASGKNTDRPQLQALLAGNWPEGSTVVVHSMDRLARSLSDLLRIVEQPRSLTSAGGVKDEQAIRSHHAQSLYGHREVLAHQPSHSAD
jgi:hypothetical protein